MSTYTYDPGKVSCSTAGVKLSGYADGTFIEAARSEPLSSTKVSADGSVVTRVKSRNRSGSLTLTLLAESESNAYLDKLRALDEFGGNSVFPMVIDDGNGTEIFSATAWIEELPSYSYAKEGGTRAWKFGLSDMIPVTTPVSSAWQAIVATAEDIIEDIF
jgi:hypothetical protein